MPLRFGFKCYSANVIEELMFFCLEDRTELNGGKCSDFKMIVSWFPNLITPQSLVELFHQVGFPYILIS